MLLALDDSGAMALDPLAAVQREPSDLSRQTRAIRPEQKTEVTYIQQAICSTMYVHGLEQAPSIVQPQRQGYISSPSSAAQVISRPCGKWADAVWRARMFHDEANNDRCRSSSCPVLLGLTVGRRRFTLSAARLATKACFDCSGPAETRSLGSHA